MSKEKDATMYTIKDAATDCLIANSLGSLGTSRSDEWWSGFAGHCVKLPYRTRFIGTGNTKVVSEVTFHTLSSEKREVTVAFPLYRDNSCSFSKVAIPDFANPIKMWLNEYECWKEHPKYKERLTINDERLAEIMEGTINADSNSEEDILSLVAYITR